MDFLLHGALACYSRVNCIGQKLNTNLMKEKLYKQRQGDGCEDGEQELGKGKSERKRKEEQRDQIGAQCPLWQRVGYELMSNTWNNGIGGYPSRVRNSDLGLCIVIK